MKDPKLDEIIKLRISGLSYSEIGKEVGYTKDRCQKVAKRAETINVEPIEMYRAPVLPEELTISGDVIITSDIHTSATLKEVVEKVAVFAKRWGIKKIAVAGDVFNFDQFGKYPLWYKVTAMQDEIMSARSIFEYWLQYVDELYLCRGNHDERFIAKNSGQINMEMMADLILPGENRRKLVTSPHNSMLLASTTGTWKVCHQYQYSKDPLKIAREISKLYECHVIACHQHHGAIGTSANGKYIVADNPCMADPQRIPYKHFSVTTFPEWVAGFSILKNGELSQYCHDMPIGVK